MFDSFFKKIKNSSEKKDLTDPVCGMRAGLEINLEHTGKTFYFCSEHCRKEFEKAPERYIA